MASLKEKASKIDFSSLSTRPGQEPQSASLKQARIPRTSPGQLMEYALIPHELKVALRERVLQLLQLDVPSDGGNAAPQGDSYYERIRSQAIQEVLPNFDPNNPFLKLVLDEAMTS